MALSQMLRLSATLTVQPIDFDTKSSTTVFPGAQASSLQGDFMIPVVAGKMPALPNNYYRRLSERLGARNSFCYLTYLVALIAVFPLFNTAQAESCKCQNKAVLELAYQRAANVFIGRIVEQKANPLKPGFLQVQVEVLKRFKDDKEIRGENLIFYTPETVENCGVAFQPGFEYLIFAYGNPAFYRTTSCDPTDVLENAQVTLARVGKLAGVSVGALDNLPELKPQPTVAAPKPSPKKRNLGQLD